MFENVSYHLLFRVTKMWIFEKWTNFLTLEMRENVSYRLLFPIQTVSSNEDVDFWKVDKFSYTRNVRVMEAEKRGARNVGNISTVSSCENFSRYKRMIGENSPINVDKYTFWRTWCKIPGFSRNFRTSPPRYSRNTARTMEGRKVARL